MKIFTIIGTRPNLIKSAPISRAIKNNKKIKEIILHTGQHFDKEMSRIFFNDLELKKPNYNIKVRGGSHGDMTGRMLQKIDPILEKEKPDLVLVFGDTNSALAGALSASKLNIPLAHIESGQRSFNRKMPEEKNRIIIDHLSDILFCSTKTAKINLKNEGIPSNKISLVGDVMFDSNLMFQSLAKNSRNIFNQTKLIKKKYILLTLHRAENTDDKLILKKIINAFEKISKTIPVLIPLHPRTKNMIKSQKLSFKNVKVIKPLGYLDMLYFQKNAALIATDSGGIQKEAFFAKTPCLTLRCETEWVELIELGWNTLACPKNDDIIKKVFLSIKNFGINGQPYGKGKSAELIISKLLQNSLN